MFYRGATLSLNYDGPVMAAAYTLAVSVMFQTVLMGLFLAVRERQTLIEVLINWRWSLAVGICGVLGSIGWFTAFAMQNAAYVRALGQIELVFTFIATVLFFRERISRTEVLGIALVVAGIIILVLSR